MFYNVENAFDIYDDPVTNDDDFLPSGIMRWNYGRYKKKINQLYKTIIAAGEWNPPEIIAFCEVENRKVLEDLCYGTYLSRYEYRIIHSDSPDERGIDVCLIYRNDLVNIITSEYWIPQENEEGEFTSRSTLYVKAGYYADTIHVIVNHWPSRRGGVMAGKDLRMDISSMIRQKTDSISKKSKGSAKIIISGDFNCNPDDQEILALTAPGETGEYLVNLSMTMAAEGSGSYRYRGTWEMIDQVIVSESLLSGGSGLNTDLTMLHIFKPDFLLIQDQKYPGSTPFSTYRGFRYQGGYSDHLPVLIDLGPKVQTRKE